MSLSKLKRICNFIQGSVLARKKKIILPESAEKIDSLLKALCYEGLLQTYVRTPANKIIIWPRYDSRSQPLFTSLKVVPQAKQVFKVKSSESYKHSQNLGEITVLSDKNGFFTCTFSNPKSGSHVLSIR